MKLFKEPLDEGFPDKNIILVMDNPNTHKLGSLYATFEAKEARRIETPKHGCWMDMAEIEMVCSVGMP